MLNIKTNEGFFSGFIPDGHGGARVVLTPEYQAAIDRANRAYYRARALDAALNLDDKNIRDRLREKLLALLNGHFDNVQGRGTIEGAVSGDDVEPVGEESENKETPGELRERRRHIEGVIESLAKKLSESTSASERKELAECLARAKSTLAAANDGEPVRDYSAYQQHLDKRRRRDYGAGDAAATQKYGDDAAGLPITDAGRAGKNAAYQQHLDAVRRGEKR